MSVNLYDDALVQKLKYWTEKTKVQVYNVDEATRMLEVIADKTNDKSIKLPIISIRRPSGYTISNPNKKPMTFDGFNMENELSLQLKELYRDRSMGTISEKEFNERYKTLKNLIDNSSQAMLNAIPITISYDIDIYTRYQRENDLYVRNLIFNIINYSTLQVEFTYNGVSMRTNANLILEENVENTSSSISIFADQICRQTLSVRIEDAYLWDIRVKGVVSLDYDQIVFGQGNGIYLLNPDNLTWQRDSDVIVPNK